MIPVRFETDTQLAAAMLRLRSWALYYLTVLGDSAPQAIVAGADGKFAIGHDSCDLAYALSDEKQVTRNRRSSQL